MLRLSGREKPHYANYHQVERQSLKTASPGAVLSSAADKP